MYGSIDIMIAKFYKEAGENAAVGSYCDVQFVSRNSTVLRGGQVKGMIETLSPVQISKEAGENAAEDSYCDEQVESNNSAVLCGDEVKGMIAKLDKEAGENAAVDFYCGEQVESSNSAVLRGGEVQGGWRECRSGRREQPPNCAEQFASRISTASASAAAM